MSQAASLPEAVFFSNYDLFVNKPLVLGSFAAWGATVPQNMLFFFDLSCKTLILRTFWEDCLPKMLSKLDVLTEWSMKKSIKNMER